MICFAVFLILLVVLIGQLAIVGAAFTFRS